MIKKLEPIKAFDCSDTLQAKMQHHSYHNDCIKKINELVDAVNELKKHEEQHLDLLTQLNEMRLQNTQKAEFDPYEEQRKWIGKLCRFWDDDAFITSKDWAFGILTSIDKGMQYQYCCNVNCNFKHCEPVKPNDNAIYNGD